MAMTSNERQKRYIERLKAGSATNGTANVSDIAAWWERASGGQRKQLCEAIGGHELGDFLDANNDDFTEYLDEVIAGSLETYAANWGYKKIEAGG